MGAQVHPTAVIDDDVELGEGTRVWHFVHVCKGARIGERCVLGQNVYVGPGVRLGNGVKVQNNVSIYEGVEIADDVFLGPSCVFTNVRTPRAGVDRKDEFALTRVDRGATVGANATIVCGHDLGAFSMVGAGSVVVRGTLPYEVVVGNPARRLGWACACGHRLPEGRGALDCPRCGNGYNVRSRSCEPRA